MNQQRQKLQIKITVDQTAHNQKNNVKNAILIHIEKRYGQKGKQQRQLSGFHHLKNIQNKKNTQQSINNNKGKALLWKYQGDRHRQQIKSQMSITAAKGNNQQWYNKR